MKRKHFSIGMAFFVLALVVIFFGIITSDIRPEPRTGKDFFPAGPGVMTLPFPQDERPLSASSNVDRAGNTRVTLFTVRQADGITEDDAYRVYVYTLDPGESKLRSVERYTFSR